MEEFLATIGEIENITASSLNLKDDPKQNPMLNIKKKLKTFEKTKIMDKIIEKKFIPVKLKQTGIDPALEKIQNFFQTNKRKSSIGRKSLNDTKNSNFDAQTETKTHEENEIGYISKSFICSRRDSKSNAENPSFDSLISNACDIRKILPKKFNRRVDTAKKSFEKKFIQNFGEDYSPKLLTTNSCKCFEKNTFFRFVIL